MSAEKAYENQAVRTFDVLSLFLLIFLVSCSVFFVLSRRGDASKSEKALVDMKTLSHQILDQGLRPVPDRSVASSEPKEAHLDMDGRISKDPWGHPYYYKVVIEESGALGVVVWSSGPDGIPETRDWDLRIGSGRGSLAINYRGDDMGFFAR